MKRTKPTNDVIDIEDVSNKETSRSVAPQTKGAIVPYRSPVPALLPSALGNLDAYIHAANMAPVLSAEEEHQLAIRLRENNDLEAAQLLVVSHLRLVVSVARSYLGYGLPHADLIQEGNIGLMKAIKHFDPDRGVRLTAFATVWIKSEIQDFIIRNWRLVKVASTKNQRKLFFNLRQHKTDQRTLSEEDAYRIASELEVKPEEVIEMDTRMSGTDTSLEAPSYSDDETETYAPIDYLEAPQSSPIEKLDARDREHLQRILLQKAIKELDPRSRRVIEARWFAENSQGEISPLTLQELALELNVSAERIRQIEKKALQKLRESLIKMKS